MVQEAMVTGATTAAHDTPVDDESVAQEQQINLELDRLSTFQTPDTSPRFGISPYSEEEILARIDRMTRKSKTYRSLYAMHPELDSRNRGPSLAEIRARPTRKQMCGKASSLSRLGPQIFEKKMSAIRNGLKRITPVDLTTDTHVNNNRHTTSVDSDVDMTGTDTQQAEAEAAIAAWNPEEPSEPEEFKSLDEALGMPTELVPMMYDHQLVFRDGTRTASGRLGRAKNIYRIGWAAKGQ